jgi:hypothetical protein
LRMDVKIINGIGKFKFAVFPSIKWRVGVVCRNVQVLPVIKGFNGVHGQIYN